MKFFYGHLTGKRDMRLEPERVPGMLRAMRRRTYWDGVTVWPDAKLGPDGEGQFPRLNLSWCPEFGYEIHCMELSGKDHFVATRRKLSTPAVYVELGGQGQELWPPELFVPYEIAERAVLFLCAQAKRDPSLSWVAIDAFPRRAVRERRRSHGSESSKSDA